MRKTAKLMLLICAGIFANLTAWAQSVTFDGELRPRMEYRQGFKKPLADTLQSTLVTLQRTRFNVGYKSNLLNARISFQDYRIWGESTTKASTSKLEIYEAWAEYLLTSGLSVTVGRQAIKYDDQRILSVSNWSNSGLAHDMALLKYSTGSYQAHLGMAWNNSSDATSEEIYTNGTSMYKMMAYLWLNKQWSNGLSISLLDFNEGLQDKSNYKTVYPRITYGTYIAFKNDSLPYEFTLTGYKQNGKNLSYKDLSAYMFSATAKYWFFNKLSLLAGINYYSGTSATETAKSKTFNRLYGSNHTYNGFMEYWTTLPTGGLSDYYATLGYKFTSKLSAEMTWHLFRLNEETLDSKKNAIDKNMGSEADFTVNYNVSKAFALQAGYSFYNKSDGYKAYTKIQTVDTKAPGWAYLMLTIRPEFYKTPEAK